MSEQTFDLSQESDTYYGGSNGYQISITTIDNKPSNGYKMLWHLDNSREQQNYMKIKFKLKPDEDKIVIKELLTIVTLDLSGLMEKDYKVDGVQVYYKKVNDKSFPIAISIITNPKALGFGLTEQFSYCYGYREILNNGSESTLKNLNLLSDKIPESKDLDDEYKALYTTVHIKINHGSGNYKANTSKTKSEIQDSNIIVSVTKTDRVQNSSNFATYTHSFKGDGFNKLDMNCSDSDGYYFKDFNGSDYNNVNLDVVTIYFYFTDQDRKMPLLIQLKPKIAHKLGGTKTTMSSVFYELTDTIELKVETNTIKDGVTSNVKIFYRYKKIYKKAEITGTGYHVLTDRLELIYLTQKVEEKLKKMVPVDKNTTSSGGSSTVGIVIGVLGFIGIPSGVLAYFHFDKIRNYLSLIYNRFNDRIYH